MAAPVSRAYAAFLLTVWAFAVILLGLSAHVYKVTSIWPGPNGHGVLVQCIFAASWTTFFTTLFVIGSFIAPASMFFGAAVNFIFIFLSFLQLIVAAGSIAAVLNSYGIPIGGASSSLWKATEAFAFITAFFALFASLYAGKEYLTGKATPVKQHKEEHF
ncbi:hypothetical protein JCM10213_002938 [Rhodosporidiobolus nylandii]